MNQIQGMSGNNLMGSAGSAFQIFTVCSLKKYYNYKSKCLKYVCFGSDELTVDYIFTFNLSYEENRYYTKMNFMNTPPKVCFAVRLCECLSVSLVIIVTFCHGCRRRRHRVASSGRRVAPPWPRRMACLQRLAATDPVSLRSWSVQRARGRPGRRLQSLPSERLDAGRLGNVGRCVLESPE